VLPGPEGGFRARFSSRSTDTHRVTAAGPWRMTSAIRSWGPLNIVVGVRLLLALAIVTLAAFGLAQLATSEPQSRAFVAGSRSAPVLGYRACGNEGISSVTVYAVRGERSDLIWSIRAKSPAHPRILGVRLGSVPAGFEVTHVLPEATDWIRLRFRVSTTSGAGDGRAFDLSEIRAGYALWSDGYTPGNNIDAIAPSRFAC
jgi:hypothetical protein